MKQYLFSLAFLLSLVSGRAQSLNTDSLERILREKRVPDTSLIRARVLLGEEYPILRVSYWDSISADAGRTGMDYLLPLIWNNLGFAYNFRGEHVQAIRLYEKSISLSRRSGNLKEAANTLHNLGLLLLSLGKVEESESRINEALMIYEGLKDKTGLSQCYNSIGGVLSDKGDIINSLNNYNKALKIYEELNDIKGTAKVLNNIASIYDSQGDKHKALEYYKKCLAYFERIGDAQGIASALNNLGYIYSDLGEKKMSRQNYLASLAFSERLDDKVGAAFSKINLATSFKDEGKTDTTLTLLGEALPVLRRAEEKVSVSQAYYAISNVLVEKAKQDRKGTLMHLSGAAQYADSALMIARELGFPELLSRTEEIYSFIDEMIGNKKGAYEHYRQFIVFRDSLNNINNRRASIRDQLKYEYGKKEAVLKEHQEKERLLEESAHRTRIIILSSVFAGLIMSVAFVFWVLRTLRKTREQKQLIEKKQTEILDSIRYARRIQVSMMPRDSNILRKIEQLKGGRHA